MPRSLDPRRPRSGRVPATGRRAANRANGSMVAPAPGSHHRLGTAGAILDGIAAAMDADPSVFYLGEDVGAGGGILGDTSGLLDRFGPERVLDLPIADPAYLGRAVGAAVEGMRPIAESRHVDLMRVGLDRIDQHLATTGDDATVAVVLTAVVGGHPDGARHSPRLWGPFAHLPATKVVAPSNPYDAKGLIVSAIRDDGPVVYLIHRGLLGPSQAANDPYTTAEVPDAAYEVPIGRAAVARPGTDVTVVTVSRSVHDVLEAAHTLSGQGIDVEVIDLRSLVPLDRDAIVDSVARTGRLVVVDEDHLSYGMSGEVAASVTDVDPALLRAPVHRVANPDGPARHARAPERAVLPGPDRIEAAIRSLLAT